MCYGDDARPPAPPVRGAVGDHADLVLTSADGTRFAAYHAQPVNPSRRGIVILPDIRGLHSFYKELAVRFAEAGMPAIAFDYFGRTAGLTGRDEDFEFRPHVEQTRPDLIAADTAASLAWLRAHTAVTSVFSVGFCFGGSFSWAQSGAGHGLAGCMGFYGNPSRVADLVAGFRDPLLILAAGADFTPVEQVEAFAEQVRGLGVTVDMTVFPGAPHSFFDRTFAEHQEACEEAWRRMLSFVDANSEG